MSFKIKNKSIVSIVMGSKSDWSTLKKSAEILKKLKIQYIVKIVSAHRTPMRLVDFAKSAKKNNLAVIALYAASILSLNNKKIANNLRIWRNKQTLSVKHSPKK